MFITHVLEFGPFLKIFGQVNKDEAVKVEVAINSLEEHLSTKLPPTNNKLSIGIVCLAKYSDGIYYRSKIINFTDTGLIKVYFIDYGNEELIPLSEVNKIKQIFVVLFLFFLCFFLSCKQIACEKERIKISAASDIMKEKKR